MVDTTPIERNQRRDSVDQNMMGGMSMSKPAATHTPHAEAVVTAHDETTMPATIKRREPCFTLGVSVPSNMRAREA